MRAAIMTVAANGAQQVLRAPLNPRFWLWLVTGTGLAVLLCILRRRSERNAPPAGDDDLMVMVDVVRGDRTTQPVRRADGHLAVTDGLSEALRKITEEGAPRD